MRAYLLHLWLFRIAESSTFAFGTFFALHVTGSVGWAVAWGVANGAALFAMRASGGATLIPLMRAVGPRAAAVAGLSLQAAGGLAMLNVHRGGGLLLTAGAVSACGSSIYIAILHGGLFARIGSGKKPGAATAATEAVSVAAVLVTAAFGTAFGRSAPGLLYLLPTAALVAAAVALRWVSFPPTDFSASYSPRRLTRAVSARCLWANFNPDFQLTTRAVPIILVTALGESYALPWLVWLPVLQAGVSIGVGHCFDARRVLPVRAFTVLWIGGWIAAGFTPADRLAYVVAALNMLGTGISTTRDAKTAVEVATSGNTLAATMAFETSRAAGIVAGNVLIAAACLVAGGVPAAILCLGALTSFGKVSYVWNGARP